MNRKKRKIIIYSFDKDTKLIVSEEILTTKPLTEHEFNSILRLELKRRYNCCYIVK